MSTKVSTWVWEHADIKDKGELLVMLALADISDHDGYCGYAKRDQRTQRELAERCRMGESTFQAKVARLRDGGFLSTSRDGRLLPNQYQIIVPWATPETEGSSEGDPDSRARTPENGVSEAQDWGVGGPDSGGRSFTSDVTDVSNVSAKKQTLGERYAEPLCRVLIELMRGNSVKVPETIPAQWIADARLMVDKDGRDPFAAKALIEWAAGDSFWRGNILSLPKFRAKYDQLRLQAERKPGGKLAPAARAESVIEMGQRLARQTDPKSVNG